MDRTEGEADREVEIRRRLLQHIVRHWDDSIEDTAEDGFSELLHDAHEELLEELLAPLFANSTFWPQRMAAEILKLPTEDEYELADLLERFENLEREEHVAIGRRPN